MSDYGLQVINDAGFTQIDNTLKNMRIIQYGTAVFDSVQQMWTISYPDFGFVPIVMLSPQPGFSGGGGGPFDRTIAEVRIGRTSTVFNSYPVIEYGAPGFNVDYAILAPVSDVIIDPPNYGLVLYDEAGKAVFSSSELYMAIDMIHTMSSIFPGYQFYTDIPLPVPPMGKRYFSLDDRAMMSTGNLQMLGGWLYSENLLRLGQFGWQYGIVPGGEPIQTLIGYFNP